MASIPARRTVPHPSTHVVGVLLLVGAVALLAWAVWLSRTLGPGEHRWHWVWLDVVEVAGLAVTGVSLLRGRRRVTGVVALLTAPLLWYDAALDVVSAHGSPADLLLACAMALLVELPSSLALLRVGRLVLRPPATGDGRAPGRRCPEEA